MAPDARQSIVVVWFKTTDLRTHDHEPLCAAHATGKPVLHLFVQDPRWLRATPLGGFPRTGPLRARFQLEALGDLAGRLRSEGHELTVRRRLSAARAFEELCEDFDVAGVFASREVCPEELRVEESVRQVLHKRGAGPLNLFWTYELHHHADLPDDVRRKGASGFSGWRRCFADRCRVRPPLPRPDFKKTAPGARWARAEPLPADVAELGFTSAPPLDCRAEVAWQGGETAALGRVHEYFFGSDAIALDFAGATNFPHEGHSSTKEGSLTKLSPWLSHGCLSARWLFAELKRYEKERRKTDSTARLVHELYFRDFVRFSSLLKGSKIFKLDGIYGRHPPGGWLQDKEEVLEPWRRGETGYPFVDAAMRELEATGHCSHAGREVAAWFLVCDLGLDWRLGAEWFESMLIDYEPASNWFNWAFTIVPRATGGNSIQEEASPYQPPRTRLQTLEVVYWAAQHDPDGEYIRRWVPELRSLTAPLAREPWRATGVTSAVAARDRRAPAEERPPPVAKERERIGWARRTFSAGGKDIEVWWFSRFGASPPAAAPAAAGGAAPAGGGGAKTKRVDPEDGKAYTVGELREKYRGQYAAKEVDRYFQTQCSAAEEARADPEDGKEYTLTELRAKYRGKYKQREVDEYFESTCTAPQEPPRAAAAPPTATAAAAPGSPPDRGGGAGQGGGAQAIAGWPSGYPLPLLPPASLAAIEEVAECARRAQQRKAAKSERLRRERPAAPSRAEAAAAEGEEVVAEGPKSRRSGGGRWGRAAGG